MLLENLDAKGFDLTEEEVKKINSLNLNLRFNDPLEVSITNYCCEVYLTFAVLWLSADIQLTHFSCGDVSK
jgi:hypothetical protein